MQGDANEFILALEGDKNEVNAFVAGDSNNVLIAGNEDDTQKATVNNGLINLNIEGASNSVDLLLESAAHEKKAVSLYKELVNEVNGESIYLEEYGREMIKAEEIHNIEIQKMLKDFST